MFSPTALKICALPIYSSFSSNSWKLIIFFTVSIIVPILEYYIGILFGIIHCLASIWEGSLSLLLPFFFSCFSFPSCCLVAHFVYVTPYLGFPESSVGKESACNAGDPVSMVRKICWRRDRLPTPVVLGFPCGPAGKESTCNAGDLGSIPGLGRSPGEGKGYPLQYSGLENSMDYTFHGVANNWIGLSEFHFNFTPYLGFS